MGDSYIAGEGGATSAYPYLNGSDDHKGNDRDLCHRSARTWAMQTARELAPSAPAFDPVDTGIPGSSTTAGDKIWFLACSGAVTAGIKRLRESRIFTGGYHPPAAIERDNTTCPSRKDRTASTIGSC